MQLKAWCYYESRLLGAHHGLISSYALEVLVLYIFNLHHGDLHTPLDVSDRLAMGHLMSNLGAPCRNRVVENHHRFHCCRRERLALCITNAMQVMRHFLAELGTFDWERYCLALEGPVPIAELHKLHGE